MSDIVREPRKTWAVWENTVLAFETLRDRLFRSFLTVLGVSIGVIIIVGVASVLNGFRQGVVERIETFGTDKISISRFPQMTLTRASYEIRHRKPLSLDDAWAIRDQCPAVLAVNPQQYEDANTVKYRDRELYMPMVCGCFPEIQQVTPQELADGRYFTASENQQRVPVGVIGYSAAQILFPHETAIGKEITVNGSQIRVIGVLAKFNNPGAGDDNPQDQIIIMPYYVFKQALDEWGWDDHYIEVRARAGQLKLAMEQIEEVLRRRRHVAWTAPNDFEMNTAETLVAAFDQIVFATIAVMFALSTVAFMVGGVGVMNVMFASVKERTREIGVRRAIGARRRDIIWQFLIEAMAMTGGGGLLGVAIGEIIMRSLHLLLPTMSNVTPMWARIFGFFGSMSVGLLFGLWPAITAARLDPIKALRYE